MSMKSHAVPRRFRNSILKVEKFDNATKVKQEEKPEEDTCTTSQCDRGHFTGDSVCIESILRCVNQQLWFLLLRTEHGMASEMPWWACHGGPCVASRVRCASCRVMLSGECSVWTAFSWEGEKLMFPSPVYCFIVRSR